MDWDKDNGKARWKIFFWIWCNFYSRCHQSWWETSWFYFNGSCDGNWTHSFNAASVQIITLSHTPIHVPFQISLLNLCSHRYLQKLFSEFIQIVIFSVWSVVVKVITCFLFRTNPDSKVHGANMGQTWGPSGAKKIQVGPMLAPQTFLPGKQLPELMLTFWLLGL